ncbi:MAG: energy transducer TonB [Deltaproteobacteria bacterium]|nr:energy transducer TonB [Deltaproteobacteria bacterium]
MDGNSWPLGEFAPLPPEPERDVPALRVAGPAAPAATPSAAVQQDAGATTFHVGLGQRLVGAVAALLAFVIGGLAVALVLVSMNAPPPAPPPPKESRAVVMAPPPPKPKPKPKQAPPPPQRAARPAPRSAAPPPPPVGGALAGLGYAMPGMGAGSIDGAASRATAGAVDAKAAVMTESAVDAPPRATVRRPPVFPRRARALGQEGKVTLSVLIDEDGKVEQVRVLDADPPGVFDEAAIEAVRGWRFEPARYQGNKVRVWARQTLRFRLG